MVFYNARNIVFVALEIDDAISLFVTATFVTAGQTTLVITSASLLEAAPKASALASSL